MGKFYLDSQKNTLDLFRRISEVEWRFLESGFRPSVKDGNESLKNDTMGLYIFFLSI